MSTLTIVLIAFGLSMDAFAVSVTNGIMLKQVKLREPLKVGFFFGAFQAIMPLIGWLVGIKFQKYITSFDHWIAFLLLSFIGGKMLYESIKSGDKNEGEEDFSLENKTLLLLAIATSIDALVVGVSFAFLNVSIYESIFIIGIITFIICFIGVLIGKKCGALLKNNAEIIGGIVLIIIGLKILNEHTNIIPILNIF